MGKNDDKTEKPTAKRRQKARKKGQVAMSREVSQWIVALAGTLLIPVLFRTGRARLTDLFGRVANVMTAPSVAGALGVLQSGLGDVLALVLPIAGGFAALGGPGRRGPDRRAGLPAGGGAQVRPDQSRVRLQAPVLHQFPVAAGQADPQDRPSSSSSPTRSSSALGHKLVGTQPVDMSPVVSYAGSTMLGLVRDIAVVGLLLAFGDYAVQRHKHNKSLKMTKREVKEENRQSEGDPLLKRELRRKQMRLSRARMMAAVAGADVVITNPTHFAVALRYQAGRGMPPRWWPREPTRWLCASGPRRPSTACPSSRTAPWPRPSTPPARSTPSSPGSCTWPWPGSWPSSSPCPPW